MWNKKKLMLFKNRVNNLVEHNFIGVTSQRCGLIKINKFKTKTRFWVGIAGKKQSQNNISAVLAENRGIYIISCCMFIVVSRPLHKFTL